MEITFKLILTLNPVGPGPPDPGLPDVPVLPFGNNIMRQTFRYKLHSYEYLYTSRVARRWTGEKAAIDNQGCSVTPQTYVNVWRRSRNPEQS